MAHPHSKWKAIALIFATILSAMLYKIDSMQILFWHVLLKNVVRCQS
jgi:hypothetical protein